MTVIRIRVCGQTGPYKRVPEDRFWFVPSSGQGISTHTKAYKLIAYIIIFLLVIDAIAGKFHLHIGNMSIPYLPYVKKLHICNFYVIKIESIDTSAKLQLI